MAHPDSNVAEASEAPARSGDRVEDFADFLEASEQDEEEEQGSPDEGDEQPEAEAEGDEAQDEGDEPDAPAIDPPVSWGTDAKELFGQLPPDLQKQVSEREAQREKFVQQKAAEASEAKRTASAEASVQFADTQRQYASELEQYASLLQPQRPDPVLLTQDPVAFYQLQAQFEQAQAQHQMMMQRAAYSRAEAEQREQQAQAAQFQADIAILEQAIPDWSDPAKRTEALTEVTRIGADLGYSPEIMGEASAQDILALRKAAEWKSKAAKYDALQKTKMENVRSAKALPKVSKPGVAPTKGEINTTRSQAAWSNVKAAKGRDAQANAFADYLDVAGIL